MDKYSKEQLEHYIIDDKLSYEAIGRIYNVTGNAIKKAAKNFGIELPKKRKINENETFNKEKKTEHFCIYCGNTLKDSAKKYCSPECQNSYELEEWVMKWKDGKESGISGEYNISKRLKRYFMDKYECKCLLCGWGELNPYTQTIPLELHHIDGDYENNKEENLLLLCPNCHSLTETYKSHNKEGRKNRKKYN